MPPNPNDVAPDATNMRSSIHLPVWIVVRLDAIARQTLSTRSQVIRRMLAKALDDEPEQMAS
jgi:metal-responsive CopG/Arc/MetJ family transcriptional regulator